MRQADHATGSATDVGSSAYVTIFGPQTLEGKQDRASIGWDVEDATLADVKIQVQAHPDREWMDYLDADDFAAGDSNGNVLFATSDADAVGNEGDGEAGHAEVRLNGCYAFRVMAKSASGTASVTCGATWS